MAGKGSAAPQMGKGGGKMGSLTKGATKGTKGSFVNSPASMTKKACK